MQTRVSRDNNFKVGGNFQIVDVATTTELILHNIENKAWVLFLGLKVTVAYT